MIKSVPIVQKDVEDKCANTEEELLALIRKELHQLKGLLF